MGVSIGHSIKPAAIYFVSAALVLVLFTGMQAERAEASANLTAYRTVPPNSWEPMGYNVTGTAPYFITHTLNWSNTRIMGNLGIGDGSVTALDAASNREVNYTDNNFMAADISMAPWDPGRLTAISALADAAGTASATAAAGDTNSSRMAVPDFVNMTPDIPRKVRLDDNTTQAPEKATNQTVGNAALPAGVSFNRPLNDPYHPILMGRPVDDLLYEYPLATPINMYGRLQGLRLPGGACVNIGVKCLGYGY